MARALATKAREWARRIPAFALLAAWLFVQGATFYLPKAASGTQCPTAPVQQILAPVKDCCNQIVGYQWRAPRQGEKDFLQCQCANKKASEMSIGTGMAAMPLLCPEQFALIIPWPLPTTNPPTPYVRAFSTRTAPPLVRPPTSA